MTKPIERIYVTENHLEGPMQASGFDVNPERAERFREAIGGVTRVFTEEKPPPVDPMMGHAGRIYVLDHAHPDLHRHVHETPEAARTMHEQVPGTLRVFTEEPRWVTDRAPDNGRTVLALFTRHHIQSKPQIIIAFFGSEGKWCAEDHNGRVTYLDNALVHGWRELPEVMGPLQIGLTVAARWR